MLGTVITTLMSPDCASSQHTQFEFYDVVGMQRSCLSAGLGEYEISSPANIDSVAQEFESHKSLNFPRYKASAIASFQIPDCNRPNKFGRFVTWSIFHRSRVIKRFFNSRRSAGVG